MARAMLWLCFSASVGLCLFFFFSSRRRHTRSLCDWSSDVCSSDLMVGVLTAVSVFSIWFINLCDPHKTEPYSWNDGISVWPTETLRLLICLLSAFYVLKTCVMLWQNERYLELHYGLQHCHFKRKTAPPQKQWKQWWRDRVRSWRDLL